MAMLSALTVREVSATGQAMGVAGSGYLNTVNLISAAANSTVVIFDNASAASGTVLVRLSCVIASSVSINVGNVPFKNGLWCVIGGAGTIAEVYFE